MWLVRIGSRNRWGVLDENENWIPGDPASADRIREAAKDLLPAAKDHDGLSVFEVESLEMANRVALSFAVRNRESDKNMDFVLFARTVVAGFPELSVGPSDDPSSSDELISCHRPIMGLDQSVAERLAVAVLRSEHSVHRIPREKVKKEREHRRGTSTP